MLFYLITAVSPTVLAMKSAMVLCEVVTIAALLKILRQLNLRREQVLLYAWCPLLVWEIAGSGHLDSVAMACISLALLFRLRRRPILTGLFLGIAVMTKFYPIVLLPALMLPRRPLPLGKKWAFLNPSIWDWKLPATVFALIALGYAAYSSVGTLVFGFLGGYAQEEGIATGTRYFLLDLAQHIPGPAKSSHCRLLPFCILIFIAIKLWALQTAKQKRARNRGSRLPPPHLRLRDRAHAPLLAALCLVYRVAHSVFHALVSSLPILTYLMAFFYLFTTQLADGSLAKMFILNKILYGAVAIATLIHIVFRKRTLPGLNIHQRPERAPFSPSCRPDRAPRRRRALTPAVRQAEEEKNRMRRYFENPKEQLAPTVAHEPVCLYLETTNRCNLLCTTCPRTYEQLEPEADMPWSHFTQIIDQYPHLARVVLHGIGEPMLVKDLAERVTYLKARNIYVLFNTNGTVLTEANGRALISAGLDELRVSLDAADPAVYQMVRGKDFFSQIVQNVRRFTELQRELKAPKPVVSLWLTGLRETVDQLPAFVRLAHDIGVREVYLQRLVLFDEPQSDKSLACAESALF